MRIRITNMRNRNKAIGGLTVRELTEARSCRAFLDMVKRSRESPEGLK